MQPLKSNPLVQLLIIHTRYLIGSAYAFACMVKIQGERFTSMIPEGESWNTPAHIFEVLYQSPTYWSFLGWAQFSASLLLMTQRFSKLGALLFLPISANIFMITLSYGFTGTPYITGLMLLANMILIFWDWDTLKVIVNLKPKLETFPNWMTDKTWEIVGLILFLFTIGFRWIIQSFNIFAWGGICLMIGIGGLIIGLKRRSNYQLSI
jgi:hypothetical protein